MSVRNVGSASLSNLAAVWSGSGVSGGGVQFGSGAQVSAPPTAPTLVDYAAGSIGAGTYQYAYLEAQNGNTPLSPVGTITVGANRQVMVTLPSIRRGATSRAIYRTKAGGSTFYFLSDFYGQSGDLGYHQNKFLDNTPDSSLTVALVSNGVSNYTSFAQMQVLKGVKYLRTNPDDAGLNVHADLTMLTSNGDDVSIAIDAYSGIYTRTRSQINVSMCKIGQTGTTSSYFTAYLVNDDGLAAVRSPVAALLADGQLGLGLNNQNALTQLDVLGVTAITAITGAGLMQAVIRGPNGSGNYAGLDLATGQSNNPKGRISAIQGTNGAFLVFGTSGNYSTGITNALTGLDYNGRLGVGMPMASASGAFNALLNLKSDGATDLLRWLDSSGNVKAQMDQSGVALYLYNTNETSPLNYERGAIRWASNALEVGTYVAGSGLNRNLRLVAGASVIFSAGSSDKWYINASGAFLPIAAAPPIGASGGGIGELFFAASTTARANMNIAAGVAPTTPANGDIWFDGTNLKIQIGGVTKTVTVA